MDVNASTALGVEQDPALDFTALPADHDPKFLVEAKRIYKDNKPPFVSTAGGACHAGAKRPVFITTNGQRPVVPIQADLIARNWGPRNVDGMYWTLDLNGERFIVQSFHNRGCIPGAKWVYCCWTGMGEEFEDLPLAFSCVNGDYTGAFSPRMESPATTHRSIAKTTTLTNAKVDSLHHDHSRKFTPLAKDHPVEHFDEAKALYMDSRPPFVIHKTKRPRRRVLLALQDGRFSATSIEAVVVYQKWDLGNDYPTLDLDGKRFIVMGNAGGYPGGYQYHLWLGSKAQRERKVVAYSADMKRTASRLTEQLPEADEDSSSSSFSDEEEYQDSEGGATENQYYYYDKFRKAFDPTTMPLATPSKFSTRQPIVSSRSSARKERPHRKLKRAKRARSATPPAQFGSRKGKAPAHVSKRTSHQTRYDSDDSSDLSSPPYETPAPTPSTNDRTAPTTDPQTPENQAPASLPTLTLYKQTHTTLRATRDSNIIGFVPLRLLTCMTMSTLFSSVVAASGHRELDEPVKCLMAIFDWKEESDIYKTIFIDKGTEGSFEIFLEIIDEAPCWKDEGGKCGVAIEVVRA